MGDRQQEGVQANRLWNAVSTLIVGIVLFWIAGQLSQMTDWIGVVQWIISGIMAWALLGLTRTSWYKWLARAAALWWCISVFWMLYVIASSHAPYGDGKLPAWTQWVNPIVVATVPFLIFGAVLIALPIIKRTSK